MIGTAVEFYDFLVYGTVAALVFGELFFPGADPAVGTIAAFGTFAAGYVARPIGGIVFGHVGDRLGRKNMLLLTMGLMGGAGFLIGVPPAYDTAGARAPVLLITLRVVQGIAIGGEWGGATLMVVEHAGERRRGLWSSFTQMGAPPGSPDLRLRGRPGLHPPQGPVRGLGLARAAPAERVAARRRPVRPPQGGRESAVRRGEEGPRRAEAPHPRRPAPSEARAAGLLRRHPPPSPPSAC
jgi:hypothetical protein